MGLRVYCTASGKKYNVCFCSGRMPAGLYQHFQLLGVILRFFCPAGETFAIHCTNGTKFGMGARFHSHQEVLYPQKTVNYVKCPRGISLAHFNKILGFMDSLCSIRIGLMLGLGLALGDLLKGFWIYRV